MNILVVGDVVGKGGRRILKSFLDRWKSKYDFVIVNGENAAGGFGLTIKIAEELLSYGVDMLTSGNHIWDKKEIYPYLDESDSLVRPINYPDDTPGDGYKIKEVDGKKIGVISAQGRVFMPPIDCPFKGIDRCLEKIKEECDYIVVDFHGEATSEKVALGHYLDGRVSLVYGTHTHIQTADNRVLEGGTGYITDLGMTGSSDGIIGMKKESIIEKFLTGLPKRFSVEEKNPVMNGIEVELGEDGLCKKIERIYLNEEQIEKGE